MDPEADPNLRASLEASTTIPIADLSPSLPDASTTAVRGIVTITWPYNSVNRTFAFNLAEPDFRLRRNKGQVRVNFTGRVAEAVGGCGLASNDEVFLLLDGAAWEAEEANRRQSLPGTALGWKLVYGRKVSLKITRAETGEGEVITFDDDDVPNATRAGYEAVPTQPTTPKVATSSPPFSSHHESPARDAHMTQLQDGEFASPAFLKRARMSYGSLFEGGFDIFDDDGGAKGKGRKRTRFGRGSGAWRYTSQSPSPEPDTPSPRRTSGYTSPPGQVETTDDGIQVMDLDQPPASDPAPPPDPAPPLTRSSGFSFTSLVAKDTVDEVDEGVQTTPIAQPSPLASTSGALAKPPPTTSATDLAGQAHNSSIWAAAEISAPSCNPNDTQDPEVANDTPVAREQAGSEEDTSEADTWRVPQEPPVSASQHHELSVPSHANELGAFPGLAHHPPLGQSAYLSEPGQDTIPQGEDGDGIDHSPIAEYSAVNIPEHIPNHHDGDEALVNYPTSYLEGTSTSPHDQLPQPIPQYQTTHGPTTSTWSTINRISPADRLDTMDGNTPEQAFVIDESDSDEGDSSPPPIPVEDTVKTGRAYPLDLYEDTEVADEVDVEYSDDDEPEYDPDEIGIDYDTRNYEGPSDDEDDSHDEDLRDHELEPEFDEGGSIDEDELYDMGEEEEAEEEDEESGSEREPVSPLLVRSNPPVIDLISSSSEDEDEGEDETGGRSEGNNQITGDRQPAVPIGLPGLVPPGPRSDLWIASIMEDRIEFKEEKIERYEEGEPDEGVDGDGDKDEDEMKDGADTEEERRWATDSESHQSGSKGSPTDVPQGSPLETAAAAIPLSAANDLNRYNGMVGSESPVTGAEMMSNITPGDLAIEPLSQNEVPSQAVDAQSRRSALGQTSATSEESDGAGLSVQDGDETKSIASATTKAPSTLDTGELASKPSVSTMQLPTPVMTQAAAISDGQDEGQTWGTSKVVGRRDFHDRVSADESLQQEIRTHMADMRHTPSSRFGSPAPSFQSQVDDTQSITYESEKGANDGEDSLPLPHTEIDEELQASILEYSQMDGAFDDDFLDTSASTSSPTAASAQLLRDFTEAANAAEGSDTAVQDDPSVYLARAAYSARRATASRASSAGPRRLRLSRTFDARRSWTPETEDSSLLLARASFGGQIDSPACSQAPTEEDSYSMTLAKLQLGRHLCDELPDFTTLVTLRQRLTKPLDVIAVATMQPPEPRRAKGGPREFMMSFTVSDHSIGPYAVSEVLIYRPHRDTLPVVRFGDVVLLRNFTPVSLTNKGFGLRSNDASSWAVFDREDEAAQINGPPVEYGEKEMLYVSYLRDWFGLLDAKAKSRLERANRKMINAVKFV